MTESSSRLINVPRGETVLLTGEASVQAVTGI